MLIILRLPLPFHLLASFRFTFEFQSLTTRTYQAARPFILTVWRLWLRRIRFETFRVLCIVPAVNILRDDSAQNLVVNIHVQRYTVLTLGHDTVVQPLPATVNSFYLKCDARDTRITKS